MSILMVSISHKTAPLHIRELFAFDAAQQRAVLSALRENPLVTECVLIATCNRTEIYVYVEEKHRTRQIFEWIQSVVLSYIHKKEALKETLKTDSQDKELQSDLIAPYLRFYHGDKAIRHLFEVACGLDSMVMGEDQILGQVKDAHQMAMDQHFSGTYLNALFRYAVTAAKKVKTDTKLSKTPVSTASVCIKTAQNYIGSLEGKNVMLIGAGGKIGGIVMKNLLADYHPKLFVTARHTTEVIDVTNEHHHSSYRQIPFSARYDFIKDMDVVISATTSPHYTLTYELVRKNVMPGKKMAFVDLAVPLDIEGRIGSLENIACFNIDDISRTARENNQKKSLEAEAARDILSEYEEEFKKWMIFQQSLCVMRLVKVQMISDSEQKGLETAIDKLFYRVREHVDEESLAVFMQCLEQTVSEQKN